MSRALRRPAITIAVAAVVVVVDQLAASWAVRRLADGPIHVLGPLDLQLEINTGSAFGLAQGWAPVIAAIAAVAVVVLVVSSRRARSDGLAVSVGLAVGGAAGNLADRVFRHFHGGVVDYVALHFWPTFNVADACITVGVVLVAVSLWRHAAGPRGPVAADDADGGTGQPASGAAMPRSEEDGARDEVGRVASDGGPGDAGGDAAGTEGGSRSRT